MAPFRLALGLGLLSKIFIKVSSREISGYCTAGACKMRVQIGIAFCIFVLISTTLAEPHEVENSPRNKKCTSLFTMPTLLIMNLYFLKMLPQILFVLIYIFSSRIRIQKLSSSIFMGYDLVWKKVNLFYFFKNMITYSVFLYNFSIQFVFNCHIPKSGMCLSRFFSQKWYLLYIQ